MGIRESFKQLSGRDITDPEIQRIMAAAQALGVKNDDPTVMLLMILEHNQGIVNAAPARIQKVITEAENSASRIASASIERATADLIPSIKNAVAEAAKSGMVDVQKGAAMASIWLALIAVAVIFSAGLLIGGRVHFMLEKNIIDLTKLWSIFSVYIFFALTIPVAIAMLRFLEDNFFAFGLKIYMGIIAAIMLANAVDMMYSTRISLHNAIVSAASK